MKTSTWNLLDIYSTITRHTYSGMFEAAKKLTENTKLWNKIWLHHWVYNVLRRHQDQHRSQRTFTNTVGWCLNPSVIATVNTPTISQANQRLQLCHFSLIPFNGVNRDHVKMRLAFCNGDLKVKKKKPCSADRAWLFFLSMSTILRRPWGYFYCTDKAIANFNSHWKCTIHRWSVTIQVSGTGRVLLLEVHGDSG